MTGRCPWEMALVKRKCVYVVTATETAVTGIVCLVSNDEVDQSCATSPHRAFADLLFIIEFH